MIDSIFQGLISFLQNLIDLLLSPINSIIVSIFPTYDQAIITINQMLYYISQPINFLLDASFIFDFTWTYIVTSLIFKVTAKILIYPIKLIINWWSSLV